MKVKIIIPIICVCYLVPVLGASLPGGGNLPGQTLKRGVRLLKKPGDQKSEVLEVTARGGDTVVSERSAHTLAEGAHRTEPKLRDASRIFQARSEAHVYEHAEVDDEAYDPLGNKPVMEPCAERDCKREFFLGEMSRWVKQALADVGVFINDNPLTVVAFFIGVSVLLTLLIHSGAIIPAALELVGFGAEGPIKHTLAAAFQSKIGAVKAGSVFAQLQAAAMRGIGMRQIRRIATRAFAPLIAVGAYNLVELLGQSPDLEPKAWRAWQSESRVNFSSAEVDQMVYFWGTPAPGGCIAYGYRQYRAPIWYVPQGKDPMSVCTQTPATISGIGFKTPLECANEGPGKGVVGTWYVPTNGTECTPRWSTFEDEGCILYGQRRKFARLLGLSNQDDWANVCESTPALIDSERFNRPSYCDDKGILGIFGVFDFADEACECSCVRV